MEPGRQPSLGPESGPTDILDLAQRTFGIPDGTLSLIMRPHAGDQ